MLRGGRDLMAKRRRGLVAVLAVLLVLCGLGVIAAGTEGRFQLPSNEKPVCERTTSFVVNWSNKQDRAAKIEWSVAGVSTPEKNVRAPFERLNIFLSCGAPVSLTADFSKPPKNLDCRIIVGGKTFTPSVPSDKLGRQCVVETTVPN